ncbi:uncharacterized [Tachysurus ichikawai]
MPRPSERTLNVLLCPRAGIERGRTDPTHLSTPAAFFTGQSLQERSLSQLLCNLIRPVVVNPAVELISLHSQRHRDVMFGAIRGLNGIDGSQGLLMAETLPASARWIWPKVQHSSAHFPRALLTPAQGREKSSGLEFHIDPFIVLAERR